MQIERNPKEDDQIEDTIYEVYEAIREHERYRVSRVNLNERGEITLTLTNKRSLTLKVWETLH